MIYILITLGFIIYCGQAAAIYSPFKDSSWYYIVSLLCGNTASLMWLYIAKHQTDKQSVLFYGTVWDFGIMAAYYLVPILFFDVRLTTTGLLGLLVTVVGIVIMKIGSGA